MPTSTKGWSILFRQANTVSPRNSGPHCLRVLASLHLREIRGVGQQLSVLLLLRYTICYSKLQRLARCPSGSAGGRAQRLGAGNLLSKETLIYPIRVKRVGFVMSAVRPVYPQQQTSPDTVGTSHLCQFQTRATHNDAAVECASRKGITVRITPATMDRAPSPRFSLSLLGSFELTGPDAVVY